MSEEQDTIRRALLFINGKAGRSDGPVSEALEVLEAAGIELIRADTETGDEISPAIREQAKEVDLIIIGGGDGSVHAAAEGLKDTGLPLGILPLGTGNDLARTMRIPIDPVEAAEIITRNYYREIDLGQVNDRLFFNVAQIGIGESVPRKMRDKEKERFKVGSYLLGAWRALRDSEPFTVSLSIHGESSEPRHLSFNALQIAIGNGRFFGGGFVVHEEATIFDERLHMTCLKRRELTPWRILKLVFIALAKRSGSRNDFEETLELSASEIEVVTEPPLPINADGESASQTPAVFRVLPAAVKVLSPPEEG